MTVLEILGKKVPFLEDTSKKLREAPEGDYTESIQTKVEGRIPRYAGNATVSPKTNYFPENPVWESLLDNLKTATETGYNNGGFYGVPTVEKCFDEYRGVPDSIINYWDEQGNNAVGGGIESYIRMEMDKISADA